MAIKFKCTNCGKELAVKDEFAGKQAKCPACQTIVKIPAASAAPQPAPQASAPPPPPPPPKKPVPPPVDEDLEDEPVAAPPRKKPADITEKPAARSRRDEDEDEEDERPRRRRDAIAEELSPRRRPRADDEDDDDRGRGDEDDEDSRIGPGERAGWQKARTAVQLNRIAMWLYATIWIIVLSSPFVICLLGASAISDPGGAHQAGFTLGTILGHVMRVLWLGTWVLCLIGYIFSMSTPGENGEKALGITAAALLGGQVVMTGIIIFTTQALLSGALLGPEALDMLRGLGVLALGIYLLEVGRNTVFAAYIQAVGKTLRSKKVVAGGKNILVLTPVIAIGIPLLDFLVIKLMADSGAGARGDGAAGGVTVLGIFLVTSVSFLILSLVYSKKLRVTKEIIEECC